MSPRSEEFMDRARARLRGARRSIESQEFELALSAAYYACLYAARAALSEEETYAKTHTGTWSRFGELFVAPGRIDAELASGARAMEDLREKSDYDARLISSAEAERALETASRFVDAVASALR